MTITVVQAGGTSTDNATSGTRATASNVTSGNKLIICVNKYSPSADAPVVGDISKSAGTCTVGSFALNKVVTGTTNYFYSAIYSVDVTGTGSCTITVGGAPSGSYWNIIVIEVNSSLGTMTLENTNGASAGTGAPDSGNVTSAGAAIFVGSLTTDITASVTHTIDAAYTLAFEQEDGVNHLGGAGGYRIVTTGTTDSASWSAPTDKAYSVALAVYKEASSGVTGTAAITESADTISASGAVSVTGTLAKTEGADTISASGAVSVTASGAITEAAQTISSAGTVSVTGTAANTESADTISGAGTVGSLPIDGTGIITEGADTLSGSGTVSVYGTATITEGADTLSGAAVSTITGTGAITEAADTLSGAGVVGSLPITGTATITEGADTLSGIGAVSIAGISTITEAADTLSASGAVRIAGVGAITESADTISGAGLVGTVVYTGTANITEAADTLSSAGSVSIAGTGTITETADTLASVGYVLIYGNANITEAADTVSGRGYQGALEPTADILYASRELITSVRRNINAAREIIETSVYKR